MPRRLCFHQGLLVCSQHNSKSYGWISMKFSGKGGEGRTRASVRPLEGGWGEGRTIASVRPRGGVGEEE